MANNFTIPYRANAFTFASGQAAPSTVPTTNSPCAAMDDTTDEYFVIDGIVPVEYTGSGTLKLGITAGANTTTAADDAQIDIVTEFRTQGAAEALNADNYDATPDSGTFTFSTTAYSAQLITVSLTPATTPAVGDRYRIKITRDANHGTLDSLVGDLLVTHIIFYEQV